MITIGRSPLSPLSFLAAMLLSIFMVSARADELRTLSIGAKAPDFNLPGVDGKKHRLSDFSGAKILVVVFTCNHCPTAQAYEDRIIKLHHDYHERHVALVAISPNDPLAVRLDELGYTDLGDSLDDMKLRAKDKKFPFPYLYDGETQRVSRAFGVQATPQVFIFDKDRRLRYVGRIDASKTGSVKTRDACNAIDALLAGKNVPVEKTRTFGCSTKWSDKRENARQSIERWNKEPVMLEKIDAAGVSRLAANESKKYRLVNVWATWCGPCVNELPEFVTMNRMYRKRDFELITICMDPVDKADASLRLLKQKHVAAKNYIFTSEDKDALADALDKPWEGPVPYTLLIAPGGEVVYRKQGSIDPLEVKRAVVDKLGRTY